MDVKHTAPEARRRIWTVCLLSLSYAVASMDRAIVPVAGAPIKHDLGLSDTEFGLLHGLSFVALYVLCGIPIGRLAGSIGPRRIIGCSLLSFSFMTIACGLAASAGSFFVARFGVGLGEAGLVPASVTLISMTMPRRWIGRSIAIFLTGSTIGSVVALIGGGYLLTTLGASFNSRFFGVAIASWRVLFLFAGVQGFLFGLLILSRKGPTPMPQPGEEPASFGAALRHLRQHASGYGWITAATACSLTLTQAVSAWMPMLYVRQYHLAPGDAALKLGVMLLVAAPAGQFAGGIVLDRMRRSNQLAANNLLLTTCCLACIIPAWIFCTSNDLRISELFYTLFSFVTFAATPAGMAGWQSLAPARLRALIVAILLAIVTLIGVGLGPLMVGVLTDRAFGDTHGLGYALITLISVSGICGAAAAWTGREAFTRAARLSAALS